MYCDTMNGTKTVWLHTSRTISGYDYFSWLPVAYCQNTTLCIIFKGYVKTHTWALFLKHKMYKMWLYQQTVPGDLCCISNCCISVCHMSWWHFWDVIEMFKIKSETSKHMGSWVVLDKSEIFMKKFCYMYWIFSIISFLSKKHNISEVEPTSKLCFVDKS
jgi:hypothetical protein